MLDGLQSLGAALESVDLPELGLLRTVHLVTIVSEMYASQLAHRAGHRKHYAHDTRLNMNLASRLSAADYVHAQRLRVRLSGHFYRALERVDAIVTPATGRTAPVLPRDALRTGESNLRVLDQIMRFAPAANLAGLPAVSFPAGYDDAGLPIGCQAIGRAWEEHRLLRLAAAAGTLVARREPQVLFRLLA
jgi:Asp-tRNA(Asn)/Glu-tRNA(Gln) amidotransferase A subunit family amidase